MNSWLSLQIQPLRQMCNMYIVASLCASLSKLCIPSEMAASVSVDMAIMRRLMTMRQRVVLLCPAASACVMVSAVLFDVSFSVEDGLTCGT